MLDGRDFPADLLRAWGMSAELVVAADGAADRLLEVGVRPTIIVGDMDGMRGKPGDISRLRADYAESTDCDKLLRWVRQEGHHDLTLVSIEGDLLDHMLATLSSCVAYGRNLRIALRRGIGWVFSGALQINVTPGARVPPLPLHPCKGARLNGVQWPLENADLDVGGRVSISNAATDGFVQVSAAKGTAFLFAEYSVEEMPFWD